MVAHSESLRDAALSYAARGWWVFPCKPRAKVPGTEHGFLDATLDPAQVRRWWAANPSYNLGLDCGRSGLAVIDVDPRNGGSESLAALEREHGPLPQTITALTGAGGQHFYFHAPEGIKLPSKLPPGIDLKAEGGYIIAPPSVHPNGQPYRWDAGAHPDDTPLADLPAWIVALAEKPGQRRTAAPLSDRILEGERHTTLVSWAGSMRRRGMSLDAIGAALLIENARRCDPPLPEAEVRGLAASFRAYEPVLPSQRNIRWRRGHPVIRMIEVRS